MSQNAFPFDFLMKTQPFGTSSLTTTRLAYGCWRIVAPNIRAT